MTQPWITVTVAAIKGSTPRDVGTSMRIFSDDQNGGPDGCQDGTIGGGALEWQATQIARTMLATGKTTDTRKIPLGPNLGQCCGGSVVLTFTANMSPAETDKSDLWIWGAGHVGRALVSTLAPLSTYHLTWIDTAPDRFPANIPDNVTNVTAKDPKRLVSHAPKDAHHLILTYSHDIDLHLCDALLTHGFATTGLIGSATKWARFRTKLTALGHENAEIDRITCPIGDPTLGKEPQAIAIGVAAKLLASALKGTAKGDLA